MGLNDFDKRWLTFQFKILLFVEAGLKDWINPRLQAKKYSDLSRTKEGLTTLGSIHQLLMLMT